MEHRANSKKENQAADKRRKIKTLKADE